MNRSNLRIAVMIASAVAITAVATAAVTATVGGGSTLSPADVDRLLAGSATGTPTGTHTADPTATAITGDGDLVVTLEPGMVTVHCDGDLATLRSWIPNRGFRSDDPVRGPATTVSVRFESDYHEDFKVIATCTGGRAEVKLGPDDDRGGHGDDDNSGPGHGGDDDGGHGGSGPG
jgi:hypothetical protein